MDVSCYTNAVGLANCACPCNEAIAPEGWNTSDSGLFISQLFPAEQLQGLDNCSDPDNIWTTLDEVRTQAINVFIADTNALLAKRGKPKRNPFSGSIGEGDSREVLTPLVTGSNTVATYAGLRIRCAPVRSGTMKIMKLGGVFNAAGTVAVSIYNRFNTRVSGPHNITTVAGRHVELAVDITLPLYTDYQAAQEYYFVYEVDGDNLPRKNKIHCGCSGFNPRFDCGTPHYLSGKYTGGQAWANWIMVAPWGGSDTESFDITACNFLSMDYGVGVGTANGLTIKCKIQCDAANVLCDEELNYSNPLSLSSAHAIRYKAGELLADKILMSGKVSRYVTANRDTLLAYRKEWQGRYGEMTAYIANEAPLTGDCLECFNQFNMKVGAVRT